MKYWETGDIYISIQKQALFVHWLKSGFNKYWLGEGRDDDDNLLGEVDLLLRNVMGGGELCDVINEWSLTMKYWCFYLNMKNMGLCP